MADRPRLFAELCCGSAAVTLQLIGGPKCRPPVSYQGSKRGYAHAILHALGLSPGQGADAVLLVDPGPWSKVWSVLCTPDGCREVAETIRGWVGEDARTLWKRLKVEGPLAENPATEVSRYLMLSASNRLICCDWFDGVWKNCGVGGTTHGGAEFATPAERVAGAAETVGRVPWPLTRVEGLSAAAVSPEEVAKWLLLHRWSFSERGPAHGYGGPGCVVKAPGTNWTTENRDAALERPRLAERIEGVPDFQDTLTSTTSATALEPHGDLSGCVVYIDPDYRGTTPYKHSLPREQVVDVARRWAACGATVCVSEAEPIAELVDWNALEITAARKGHKRTFSKQQREWLTCNRELRPLEGVRVPLKPPVDPVDDSRWMSLLSRLRE